MILIDESTIYRFAIRFETFIKAKYKKFRKIVLNNNFYTKYKYVFVKFASNNLKFDFHLLSDRYQIKIV